MLFAKIAILAVAVGASCNPATASDVQACLGAIKAVASKAESGGASFDASVPRGLFGWVAMQNSTPNDYASSPIGDVAALPSCAPYGLGSIEINILFAAATQTVTQPSAPDLLAKCFGAYAAYRSEMLPLISTSKREQLDLMVGRDFGGASQLLSRLFSVPIGEGNSLRGRSAELSRETTKANIFAEWIISCDELGLPIRQRFIDAVQ